jgi:hypothetical protein
MICWGYVIYSYEIQPIHYQELAGVFYNNFVWILMLTLLMVGLFAVYMARKDHESEFELLVVTYKVSNMEWVVGKWLVTQTYGLCITIITLLIQGVWFLSGSMGLEQWIQHLVYIFFQVEGAFFLLISFGFVFGIWIPNMLAYMCMPALLGVMILLQSNNYGFAYVNPRVGLLSLYDSMFIGSPFEGIWGIHAVFEGAILHQMAVIMLGIIVILAAFLLFRPNRRLKMEKSIAVTLIIILMIPTGVLSGIRYASYNSALEQFVHTGQQYLLAGEDRFLLYGTQSDYKQYDFSIERTNLNVQFPSDNQIEVSSHLSIKYNGNAPVNEVYLTLHHQLNITNCSSDGEITCSREKDWLVVHFQDRIEPHEQFDLNLNYNGNMKQYRLDGLLQHSFIESDRMYLPKEAGWYPLIGKRYLAKSTDHIPGNPYVQFELRNGGLVEDHPTEFSVEILNKQDQVPIALTIPRVHDGLYKGISQYGLSLIGGNIKEIMVDQTRVVAHPDVLNGARITTETYLKWWNYIEEWLEVPAAPEVIYMLNHDHKYLTQYTPSREFKAWSVYDNKVYVDDPVMAYRLVYDLINEHPSLGEDVHLLQRVMTWILLNHFEVETGLDRFEDWYVQESFQSQSELPIELANLVDILNRYEKQGEAQFQQVVKYLFTQYDQLEDKTEYDLEAALKMYVGERSQ